MNGFIAFGIYHEIISPKYKEQSDAQLEEIERHHAEQVPYESTSESDCPPGG